MHHLLQDLRAFPDTDAAGVGRVRSIEPVIVRDLQGNIVSWNRAAERSYGWSEQQALGSVSHQLFETIFPVALEEINAQLLRTGAWEGELIHALSDGSRMKVRSRWELVNDSRRQAAAVVEINGSFTPLRPESAHFSTSRLRQRFNALRRDKRAWLIALLGALFIAQIAFELAIEFPRFRTD